MSKKILLIGPRGGGKTEILRNYTGSHKIPSGATQGLDDKSTGLLFWEKQITEIGGGTTELINIEITQKVKGLKPDKIIFVFDGVSFLEQLQNPSIGGEIYSRLINCYWRPLFEGTSDDVSHGCSTSTDKIKSKKRQEEKDVSHRCPTSTDKFNLICTHTDIYHPGDLRMDILNAIDKANKEYSELINSNTPRYIKERFEEPYCYYINATDTKKVKDTIKQILK